MSAIQAFALSVPVLGPTDSINHVADCFLSAELRKTLSMAVVDSHGRPVGMISRHQLNGIFLKKFGRELYGSRPVSEFMRRDVLAVAVDSSLSAAASYITRHMLFPLSEDFIITREDGTYLGMGAVLHLLGAMEQQLSQDAAQLSRAYSQLAASQAQLVQSEKMAALGQMVAGVAHEINTPLGYVNNNVEMMREFCGQLQFILQAHEQLAATLLAPEATDLDIAECLATLDELKSGFDSESGFADLETLFKDTFYGIGQISELVNGLKDFSRLDKAPSDEVSLNACIDSALLIARNPLKHGIQIHKRLAADLPKVRCVASQVNQVLLNLFTNAAQAMPDGGHLLLKTWHDEHWVFVSVQDSGCGIAAEHLSRIFDPFFTTKPVGEGTGLGLSISYKIIRQHGGHIRVASELGKGTRFLVALPRRPAVAMPAVA